MENFAQSVLAGVAVGVFTAAVVKVNLFVLDKLATINTLAIETAVVMGMSTFETIKMRRQEVGMSTLEPIKMRQQISKKQEVDEMWESIRKNA